MRIYHNTVAFTAKMIYPRLTGNPDCAPTHHALTMGPKQFLHRPDNLYMNERIGISSVERVRTLVNALAWNRITEQIITRLRLHFGL